MRTIAPPPPATDDLDGHRLVLRDGSTAALRATVGGDYAALLRFFQELSPESRHKRFLTAAAPSPDVIARFCDSTDPARAVTLIACRQSGADERIIAVASYIAATSTSAEVAFAVDDRFQGKGLATLLLEQLAARAAAAGLTRFFATTLPSNTAMREVFRDAGFDVQSATADGIVDVHLALTPLAEGVAVAERRRRAATVASIHPLLAPRAVAVIGASRDERKIGTRILRAIRAAGFRGAVLPVHPVATELQGFATLRTARDLPPGVDLAVVAVPPGSVPQVVDDCAAAGVRALIVITAGYAETGDAGRAAQDRLTIQVRGLGMRMLGPNCLGLVSLHADTRLNASFAPVIPPSGGIALSSQSGALGIAILEMAAARQLGVSTFVSVGNKADVSSNDLLEYWEEDPDTRVVLLYLESFGNPRRFARIARRVSHTKPIVALKAGRTAAGSRAAASHTAALAASDAAVDALFRQTGVVRVETIDEMFDVASFFATQPLPPGRRVAIVTNAGGPGILAADACDANGLTVVPFSEDTRSRLRTTLLSTASVGNPVDMVASAAPDDYRRVIETTLAAPETDALLVIFTPVELGATPGILTAIQDGIVAARIAAGQAKPVVACVMAEANRAVPIRAAGELIPAYLFPENAVRALARAATYAEWRRQPPGLFQAFDDVRPEEARATCRRALTARGDGWLRTDEAVALLHAYAIPTAAGALAYSADEAAAIAATVAFPVAAKLAVASIQHKTEVGGVRLNLADADAVRRAFAELAGRAGVPLSAETHAGVLIQAMVPGNRELLVGVTQDRAFGPLVAFGMGGVDVEVFRDVRFGLAPLTDRDADDLIRGIRGYPLLTAHRGAPPADVDALRELLLRVSQLAQDIPEITELDLNPVIVHGRGQGLCVVDARVRVAGKASLPLGSP
jgi:acetyl coenzyme A synthetase (ADP forming)-like protein